MSNWLGINGHIVNQAENPIQMQIWDCFSYWIAQEEICCQDTKAHLLKFHQLQLKIAEDQLGLKPIPILNDLHWFEEHIRRLLIRNQQSNIAKASCFLFEYQNQTQLLIRTEALSSKHWEINAKGLRVAIADEHRKAYGQYKLFQHNMDLTSIAAKHFLTENKFDDCILLNDKHRVVGSGHAAIFCVIGDRIISPPLLEGAQQSVARELLLELLNRQSVWTLDEVPLRIEDLNKADELWLVNDLKGLQWVAAFDERRFYNTKAKEMSVKFAALLFAN